MKSGKFSAVIVAGGVSQRYGEKNKLTETFFDKTVLQHSIDAFVGLVDEIIVVGDYDYIDGVKCVNGGDTRFLSVKNGLAAVSPDADVVAVHDGARPFVSRTLVKRLLDCALQTRHSAVPYIQSTDAVCSVGIYRPLNKSELGCVQTPQCFNYQMLAEAFNSTSLQNYPDESALFYEKYGKVNLVDGEVTNRKITYYGDTPEYKVGVGFDVHAFTQGDGVILGGVTIPFDKKLLGHSDADVLCHAISDAVLSASNNKDIGHQFPDTDNKYKGANSMELLMQCVSLAHMNNYEVLNVSAVVICQAPKIAPHIDKMAAKLAVVLNIPQSCVNLTATTTEHLGALGNGDGIAVQAQALLKLINW